jgi:uncharacterized glyoxalase superfamily protein PhnB
MAHTTNSTITPVLHYQDPEKALQFLSEAFAFREHAVHRSPDGQIQYAEMEFRGAYIGFGPTREDDNPFDLGACAVYVTLDDPDAHHDRAIAAGAQLVMGLTDQDYGSRDYAVRDPEGNVWCFGTFRPGEA